MTDFLLQKTSDRKTVYNRSPGLWYSKELRRWMVTSPELIRLAMYDGAFSVPSYDVSQITQRLDIDVRYLSELREWFPLAVEGAKHRMLREKFARHIGQYSKQALATLDEELNEKKKNLTNIPVGEVFCLYTEVLRPVILNSLVTLADLNASLNLKLEDLPLLFDVRLPIKIRKSLNELLGRIIEGQRSDVGHEERYLRAAILTLSVNTLMGSVGLTILDEIHKAPNVALKEIKWPNQLTRTGLPIIEKIATRDVVFGGQQICAGQGLRLFIESEGVNLDGSYSFSEIFFAVGSHKCLGMNFSKQVWERFRSFISSIDRSIQIVQVSERPRDYVFNFPNLIKVRFDG